MITQKGKEILEKGKSYRLGPYDFPHGGIYIVVYEGKYYSIIDDGTETGARNTGEPCEISQEEVEIECRALLGKLGEELLKKILEEK